MKRGDGGWGRERRGWCSESKREWNGEEGERECKRMKGIERESGREGESEREESSRRE